MLFHKSSKDNITNAISLEYNEDIDLNDYSKPILLDFASEFCAPCKMYQKTLEMLVKDYGNDFVIKTIDVNKYPELAEKHNVMSIPKQVFFNIKGEIAFEHIGTLSYDDTLKKLKECKG